MRTSLIAFLMTLATQAGAEVLRCTAKNVSAVRSDGIKYDPKAFIRKIADELEMNDVKYDMTFWDNYVDEILTRIQKPEPRFAHGGLV